MVISNLSEGENSFCSLAENLPGIVYRVLIEDDNRVIFFNDMIQTMTGYSPEDLKKVKVCSIDPLILPEDKLNVINIVKNAIENNVPFEAEYRIHNKGGELKYFFERGRPIRGDNGTPSYIDGVIFDITNRKKAEQKLKESEKNFKTIFDESPIGIELYDSNGKLVDLNESCLDIFGVSSIDDVRGFELFKDPNIPKEQLKKLKKGHIIRQETLFDFDLVKDLNLYKTKKSGKIWIDLLISPLYLEENNTISNYLIQIQDVTESKIAEQKLKVLNEELDKRIHERTKQLKKSEEQHKRLSTELETILDNYPGLAFYKDTNNNFIRINQKLVDYYNSDTDAVMANLTKRDIEGKNLSDLLQKDIAQAYWDDDLEVIKSGTPKLNMEDSFKTEHGIRWLNSHKIPDFDENGEVRGIIGFSIDITERKKAEQKLEESENKFKLYYENAPMGYQSLDSNGNILDVNKAWINFFGYSKEEVIGKPFGDFIDSEYLEVYNTRFLNFKETGELAEADFEIIKKDGSHAIVLFNGNINFDENGNFKQTHCIFQDITEQMQMQRELQESEILLKDAQELAHIGHWRLNPSTLEVTGSDELFKIFGLTHDEATLEKFTEVVHPEDREMDLFHIRRGMEKGESWDIEHRVISKDGKEKWVHALGEAIKDDDGKVIMLMGTVQDITARKKMMEELRIKNLVFNASLSAQSTTDINGIIDHVNPAFLKMWGYKSNEEAIGNSVESFFANPDDAVPILEALTETGKWEGEFLAKRCDGSKFISQGFASAIYNENGVQIGFQSANLNITKRREAELKLKESETSYRHISNELEVVLDHIPGIVVYKDTENNILRVNKFMADAHNLKKVEMENRSSFDFYPRDIAQVYWDDDLEVINSKQPKINIVEPWETDAGTRWVNTSKIPYIDENGNVKGIIAIAFDVTERLLAEQKLKESEEKFRTITEQSFMGIIIIQDSLFKYFNQRAVDVSGYSLEEIQNWKEYEYLKVIHPEDLDFVKGQARKELDGKIDVLNRYEYRIIKKSGEIAWMDNYSKTIEYKGKSAALIMTEDITDKIIAEQKLKESKEKYREQNVFLNNILESLTHPFYVINVTDYKVTLTNSTASSEGLEKGKYCYSLTHHNNKPCEAPCVCPLNEVKKTKKSCVVEHIHYDKEGNEKIYEIYGYPILDENGNVVQMIEYALNITDRKIAQQALKKSERKYRGFVNNISDIIYETDIKGKCSYVSHQLFDISGFFPEEIIDQNVFKFVHPDDLFKVTEEVKIAFNSEDNRYIEFRLRHKDGHYVSVSSRFSTITIGEKQKLTGVLVDITERKKADQKLKESEENSRDLARQWRTTFDAMSECVFLLDLDRKIIQCNKITLDFLGKKDYGEIIGHSCCEIIHGTNEPVEWCPMVRMIESSHKESYIVKIGDRWCEISLDPVINDEGTLIGAVHIITDITERVEVEQELKESEENFRTITEDSHLAITILQDDLVVYTNQKMADMFGYEREEMLTWTPKEYAKTVAKDSLEFVMEQARKKQIGDPDIELQYPIHCVKSSGEKFWVDNISTTIMFKGRPADLVTIIDITEKRKAEIELKESEEKFRKQNVFLNNILESLTHPFYVINADDYTVALANFTASSEGLELGQHCYSLTHNTNEPCEAPCKCPLDEVKRTKNSCLVEHTHSDSKGNEKVYEIYGYPILDENGNVVQMIEYALNITDRKKAQRELKESEKNYRDLFENSPISLWEQNYSEIKKYIDKLKNSGINDLRSYLDQNPEEVKKCVSMAKVININQETVKLFKANNEEEFFAGLDIVFAEESFDTFKEQIITFAGGKKRFESEAVNYSLNGDKLNIFIVCEIVAGFEDDWSKVLISIVDISERKKAELIIQNEIVNLRELDQLKTEFIIRTSHELKTPLVSICGSVEFLLNYIEEDFSMKSRAHLETIDSGGKRLRQLADNLLDILRIESRKYEINMETINLGNIINRCISGFKNLAEGREITISTSIQHEFYIKVDEIKIEQVIFNLLSNSLNNTPRYGQISISSEETQGNIKIKIMDTGVGFTEEEKTRIFEKFGKIERYGKGMDVLTEGSGLGLYLSKEIVELHGGKIWLESEGRDKGSTFTVSLPIDEK